VFTGLVADSGEVVSLEQTPDGIRIAVTTALASELAEGDSVAVNGVCLTATEVGAGRFLADVINQTVRTTSLAALEPGRHVNLELPLRPSDRLGGHVVQGHVDGTGTVAAVEPDGFARRLTIDAPAELLRYVVSKGSIAVDGVSLTAHQSGLGEAGGHGQPRS